jgi:hypothetical protein
MYTTMWLLLLNLTWIAINCSKAASPHNDTKNETIQEEMQMFLADNGLKYVTLIENSTTPSATKSKMAWAIVKGRTSYVQSLTMNEYRERYTFQFRDFQVFIVDFEKDNIHTFLEVITQAPVQSSVICIKSHWGDSEVAELKNALDEFKLDSLFYLAVSLEHNNKWYQVITLKSGYAITKIKFSSASFQIIKEYDLNGLTIYSISLSWSPYLILDDCDQVGQNCTTYGYLKDYTDVLAKKLNFTYESQREVDGDWGTLPKSGPYNRSGKWGGVMGGIINAKYDMSLSSWIRTTQNSDMMYSVTIISTNDLIVWTPTNQEMDFGLFVRPFSPESWLAISLLTIIATACIFITQYVIPNADGTNGQTIIETTLFIFYVVLSAFYGGALTMFFTSPTHNKFEDIVDVIRAYPEWKLVFLSGYEYKFELKAAYDPDYANFWARAQSFPQDTTINSLEEGFSLIAKEKAVMCVDKHRLNAYLAANPTKMLRLESLVTVKNMQKGIAFPFNSPLRHMFDKAVMQARESGVEGSLIKKWMGAITSNELMVENAQLSVKQLILAFVSFTAAISTCIVILCAEFGTMIMIKYRCSYYG